MANTSRIIEKACERFQSERTRFYKRTFIYIVSSGAIPSQANYFLCEVIAKYSSTALTRLLLYSSNILIKRLFYQTSV